MTEALKASEKNERIPTRLVICVDGTWTGPDGTYPAKNGNISNVFRIWCCTQEGLVTGPDGGQWQQQRIYVRGIDDTGNWLGKAVAGVFGRGVEKQIKDVYQMCCEKACHPEDEVLLFGYSRGAFVVRAVANLIAYMRLPRTTENQGSFDQAYARTLEIYKAVRSGGKQQAGSIYEYMSSSRPAPRIQFVGVLDTVRAFEDDGLYEIGLHPALRHCRQALALTETDPALEPLLWLLRARTAEYELRKASKLHSVLEAWFLGTHGSLGGAKPEDGAALYAAQWLLSEAQDVGLVLGYDAPKIDSMSVPRGVDMGNPLEALFPAPLVDISENVRTDGIVMKNGIKIKLWDMRETHRRPGLALALPGSRWTLARRERQIFSDEKLVGHLVEAPLGVFVHPSVYTILDGGFSSTPIDLGSALRRALDHDRGDQMGGTILASKVSDQISTPTATKFRLLVCGSAGVGKSTLVNLLLGVPDITQESHGAHGVHDVETGFSPDGAPYIVHDSCGFQAGQDDELNRIRSFLQKRSRSSDLDERVHLLLYCISSTRLRTTESADAEVFRLVAESDSQIPIVVVATRIDEVEALCSDEIERNVLLESGKKSRRQLTSDEWDTIESRVQQTLDQKKESITAALQTAGTDFVGPVFTSKDDSKSITALTETITKNITDDRVREMFIAAQICSVQPKIDYAIDNSIRLYGHAIRTSALPIAFSGLVASTTITALIVNDILKAFQFTGYSTDIAVRTISTMLVGNYESNGIYVTANLLSVAAAGSMTTVFVSPLGMALGAGSYMLKLSAVPQFGRMLLMCTIDTVLIMERVFWISASRASTLSDLREACASYKDKMDVVHAAVKNVLPLWSVWDAFQFTKLRTQLGRIVDEHRFRKDQK